MKSFFSLLATMLLLALAGCGGGGGGSSSGGGAPSVSASSGGVTVSWTSPSQNEDDTSLSDLNGYKIYFGQTSGAYDDADSPKTLSCEDVSCGCNTNTSCDYLVSETLLGAGQWCFVITSLDESNNESGYSNEVCTTI